MNPLSVAIKGKGLASFLRRGASIVSRYGITADRLDRALGEIAAVLARFECSATFPITSVVLQRHPAIIQKYQRQALEFAVHGYRHQDHSQLPLEQQREHLQRARRIFEAAGIPVAGFRGPYLRRGPDTLALLQELGFQYDSSQSLAWDVLAGRETPAYRRVLGFYGSLSAAAEPAWPHLAGRLVCLPYSLPDDEALVERLDLATAAERQAAWLTILRRTHELGELFTLGLHPERTQLCLEPLMAVLAEARSFRQRVWIARLADLAAWWLARDGAQLTVAQTGERTYQVTVVGPPELTILTRGMEVLAPTRVWADGYDQVNATTFAVRAPCRPVIGIAPLASPALRDFLRQQGYAAEMHQGACGGRERGAYAYSLGEDEDASGAAQRPLLVRIDQAAPCLVRLGRWPNAARSALSVTGDIDALTVWDYGLRFLER